MKKLLNGLKDLFNMAKTVSMINDLIIQVLKNESGIKEKAANGDAMSCYMMGLKYMLGINTPISFKQAQQYFDNQSLAHNSNAKRLLGFLSECNGDYSQAFRNYQKAAEISADNPSKPYLHRVYAERNNLRNYFENIGVSSKVLNSVISSVLEDYVNESSSNISSIIKIAYICEDEQSCLEAASSLLNFGDLYSAKKWLQKGRIDSDNPVFVTVENKRKEEKESLISSKTFEVLDIDGVTLLEGINSSISYNNIKKDCDSEIDLCIKGWKESASQIVAYVKKMLVEEEINRLQRIKDEEDARQRRIQEEEAARQRKLQEEEAARQRILQEEEAERRRKKRAEKAARQRKVRAEKKTLLKQQQEEDLRYSFSLHVITQIENHKIVYLSILLLILSIPFVIGFKFLPYFIFMVFCCWSHWFVVTVMAEKELYKNLLKRGVRVFDIHIAVSILFALIFTYFGFGYFVIFNICGLAILLCCILYWYIKKH